MMTLEEMKLAVCEKLPELIQWRRGAIRWLRDDEPRVHWSTEGLQVCHEAEKELNYDQMIKYVVAISVIRLKLDANSYCNVAPEYVVTATYEQRLEALTRVWFPERYE